MQLVCGTCQLDFDVPEGTGTVPCPICRRNLRPMEQESAPAPAEEPPLEWSGGTLDDLVEMLSVPALAARIDVLAPGDDRSAGGNKLGEVHLLAGGINEAIHGDARGDAAMDRLRAIAGARFRVEPVLPRPEDGDVGSPGPREGSLAERPLAKLMRYCETYVLTCAIEVWRGNQSARVEYAKGEIGRIMVGGIDAPERLADVMSWSSGSYRFVVPHLALPAEPAPTRRAIRLPERPTRRTPEPARPVAAASGGPAAGGASGAGALTIFGMPAPAITASSRPGEGPSAPPGPAIAPATTLPFMPKTVVDQIRGAGRFTAEGMPVALFDAPVPARMTNPGLRAPEGGEGQAMRTQDAIGDGAPLPGSQHEPPPPGEMAMQPAARGAPSLVTDVGSDAHRSTRPGYIPVSPPEVVLARPPGTAAERQAAARRAVKPYSKRKAGGVARMGGRSDQTPGWVYVGVGFAVGLGFVGVYYLAQFITGP